MYNILIQCHQYRHNLHFEREPVLTCSFIAFQIMGA